MRLFKRAAETAEDPYVTARLGEIAARCKTEASLYETAEKPGRPQVAGRRPSNRFKKSGQAA